MTEIQVQINDLAFALKKNPDGWQLTSPTAEKADPIKVQTFLVRIGSLQTSEFFEAERIRDPGLSPPAMTIKIWQPPGTLTGVSPAPTSRLSTCKSDDTTRAERRSSPSWKTTR